MEVRDLLQCVPVSRNYFSFTHATVTRLQYFPGDARLRALVYKFSSSGIQPHTLLSEAKTTVRQVKSILGRKVKLAAFKLYPALHKVRSFPGRDREFIV